MSIIKITIDWHEINLILQRIVKLLIASRAYKGYCVWINQEDAKPVTYNEFCKFEYWKIEIAFRQYFAWCKKNDYRKAKVSFKSVIFNIL